MQAPLGVTRLLDWMDFRAQIVRAQEIVGDPQSSRGVSF
jgi:hypothetical protein